ncbi:MAG: archease [Halodesulfurarchaeum sp.]|nr:archease [Halodesulfurarchaeum sp.]
MNDGSEHDGDADRESGLAPRSTRFELKSHTADVAIEATAPTLDGVFGAVADGLASAHLDEIPDHGDPLEVTVRAESLSATLFDYLDRLIYVRDVENVLPVENRVTVREVGSEWVVEGTARGVPLADVAAREVKAITYSEMVLEDRNGEWYAYVVVDV